MAVKLATRYVNRLPTYYRQEDFEQSALLSLWEAAQTYDEASGVKFTTFAYQHVMHALAREWWKHGVFGLKTCLAERKSEFFRYVSIPRNIENYLPVTLPKHEGELADVEFVQTMLDRVKDDRVREVTRSHYLNGEGAVVISRKWGIHHNTVNRIISRGYEQLVNISHYYLR